jgi:hypothetical protein
MIPLWAVIGLAAFAGGWVGWFLGEHLRGRPLAGLVLAIWPCPAVCVFMLLIGCQGWELLVPLVFVPVGWAQILILEDFRITCLVCGAKILPDEPVCLQCGHEPPPP